MDLKYANWRGLSYLFAAYSLIAGAYWLLRAGPTMTAGGAFGLHLAIAGGLIAAARNWKPKNRLAEKVIVLLTPWVLWLLAWSEIGWLFEFAAPEYFDPAAARLDRALFGVHWNELLPALWSGRLWREFMTGIYLSYYLLILGPPLILIWRRRHTCFLNYTSGLMFTYLGCFTIYLMFPVQGPRDMALASGTISAVDFVGFFPRIMDFVFRTGDSLGTAFPSSHCAGATAAALLCRRHFRGRAGLLCAAWAVLIIISTVHTNNHYAIDAVAGVGLAILVQIKEHRHEKNTGHRRDRFYRPASRFPAHPARTQSPRVGSGSA